MNREQKAAVVEDVAAQIKESEAVFAVDYRGISVPEAAVLRERLGDDADGGALLVGDRPSTDGLMARRLKLPFALVLSGVTKEEPTGDDAADKVAPDLATLVDQELGER